MQIFLKFGSITEAHCFIMQFCNCNDKKKKRCNIEYFKVNLQEIDFDLESVAQGQHEKIICSSVNGIMPVQCNIVTNILEENNCLATPILKIKKAVLGSFHEGNQMFGETAGIQCTSNAFLAICFSAVKNVSVWKPFDLDYILYHGDNLMKSLEAFQPLAVDELPLSVNIEGCCIKVRKLMLYNDVFHDIDLFLYHKQMTSEFR